MGAGGRDTGRAMSRENVNRLYAIGAFRTGGGLSPWVAPKLLGRTYGGELDSGSLLWSRLAGSREAALALGPILSQGDERRRWLQIGLACDLAVMAATMLGARGPDRLSRRGVGLALVTYAVSALLTASALNSVGPQE